jgi:hypothetical protein
MTKRDHESDLRQRIEGAIAWMRAKGWQRVLAKRGTAGRPVHVQTLFDHTLNLLEVLVGLAPFLVGQWGGRAAFSIEEFETLFAAVLGHDVGKGTEPWQQYVKGLGAWVSHIRPDLVNEVVAEWLKADQRADASIVVQRHHAGDKELEAEHLAGVLGGKHGRRHVDLARLLRQIDHVASAPTLAEARRAIEEGVDRPLADVVTTAVHQVVVRGVTTTLLHRATLDAFVETGWRPLLHFPEGTLYAGDCQNPPTKPTQSAIDTRLGHAIDRLFNEASIERQVVGNPTASMIAKPDLFDAGEFRSYLLEAMTRATPAGFRRKPLNKRVAVIRSYYGQRRFCDHDLPEIFTSPWPKAGVENVAWAVTFGAVMDQFTECMAEAHPEMAAFKLFTSAWPAGIENVAWAATLAAVVDRLTERIAEGQPEICAFKFFRDAVGIGGKKLMEPDRVGLPAEVVQECEREAEKSRKKGADAAAERLEKLIDEKRRILAVQFEALVEWAFDGLGSGAYAQLKGTTTLDAARDMASVIDRFWSQDASTFGMGSTGTKVRDVAPDTRRELLVELLDRIAQAAWGSLPSESVPRRVSSAVVAREILRDLVEPVFIRGTPADARRALDAYCVAKQTARRAEGLHVCPLCNTHFGDGQIAKADFLNKATAFTNRVPALARGGGGVVICDACRFDRFIEQLLLGQKSAAMLALYPRGQLGPQRGVLLVATARQLLAEWSKYMTPATRSPERHVSLALTGIIARQLEALSELEGIAPAALAEIFVYQNADERQKANRRDLKKALAERAGEGIDEWNAFWNQNCVSEDDFVEAVLKGEDWVRNDSELSRLRIEVCGVKTDLQVVAQTPHMVLLLVPTGFAVGNESDVNAAIRALFAMLVLGRALDCTVALVEDGRPWEPDMVRGIVKVPDNPALRELVGGEWIDLGNADRWIQAIGAAAQLAPATAFPERSNLYRILTAPTAGHIVRRIDMNKDSGGYQQRHSDLVHRIASVLEFAGIRYVPAAAS